MTSGQETERVYSYNLAWSPHGAITCVLRSSKCDIMYKYLTNDHSGKFCHSEASVGLSVSYISTAAVAFTHHLGAAHALNQPNKRPYS